jgi:hypothetical protein
MIEKLALFTDIRAYICIGGVKNNIQVVLSPLKLTGMLTYATSASVSIPVA